MNTEDLKKFLETKKIEAKFFSFKDDTITAKTAANRLGVNIGKIAKSIVFIDEKGSPILAIVSGDKKVDEKKLASLYGAKKVRIATGEEVKEFTGYEVGAVPPFGHKTKIKTIIDKSIMSLDKVFCGGGEVNTVIELKPEDIKKFTEALVSDISK